ncbi:MAG TPA: PGPGW domain-containing protein [Actinomycetota bacterium]|nr:PGPGW domain-containing protein [Actinomycetota bacterium]
MRNDDTHQFEASRTRELPRVTAVKQSRRFFVLALGITLIAAGLALVVLPGPFSLPLIFLGLTVLSWEYPAAKRLLFNLKSKIRQVRASRSRSRR